MRGDKINVTVLVLVAVVAILLIRMCNQSKTIKDQKQSEDLNLALTDTLTKEVNEDGDTVYSKKTFIAEIGLLTDALAKKDAELAQLAKQKNKVAIKTVTVTKYVDSGKTIIDTIKDTRSATIQNPHFTAKIVSSPQKTTLDLSARDTAIYAIDKQGYLKVKHSNPYLSVVDQNSFLVLPKHRTKNWKYIVGGIIAGGLVYGIAK